MQTLRVSRSQKNFIEKHSEDKKLINKSHHFLDAFAKLLLYQIALFKKH